MLLGVMSAAGTAHAASVYTLTGSTAGYADSALIRFDTPYGVALDSAGNIFVADSVNHRIRKVGPTGLVTVFAGSGSAAFANGAGTSASFNTPTDVEVDASGNVYVADSANNRIRKITSAGVVSTLAGSGSAAFADGTGAAASFNAPRGVSVDASGNVYVADTGNNRIRRVTSAGVVSTLAGSGSAAFADGTGAAASFNAPRGVSVDASGNVYVADTGNNRIRRVTSTGVVSTLAGSGSAAFADGTGAGASFSAPAGVAVDSAGNVFVGDTGNHRIRKVTPVGVVSTLAGSGSAANADGTGASASFSSPAGLAMSSGGNVYVADSANHRIRRVTPGGAVGTAAGSIAGYANTGTTRLNEPRSVAADAAGNVYVADSANHRIRKVTPSGIVSTLAGSGTAGYADGVGTAASFSTPAGVAVDPAGNVYVGDYGNNRIRKITSSGVVSTLAGSGVEGFADGVGTAARFDTPRCVAVDAVGNVYVGDGDNHRVRKITPAGFVSTLAGSGTAGFADGVGAAAMFDTPRGVAVDAVGNVYVGDGGNRIRKITPSGVVSTLAGSGSAAYADGVGTAASFNGPIGVSVDSAGNVFVADTFNGRIRKVTPAGVVSTWAGSGTSGYTEGVGTVASFYDPLSVAADPFGNVYVADCQNHRVRMITPEQVVCTLAGSTAGYTDSTPAQLNTPYGAALDAGGNVFVADSANHRIRKIGPTGAVSTFAGSGSAAYADGSDTSASFNTPRGICVDASGNAYVADTSNNRIRKITSAGVVSTLAGSGSAAYADGTGAAASFNAPRGVSVDASGNVYVADTGNNRIRKITSSGVVSTLAGSGSAAYANGTGAAASFNAPAGAAVDASGNVYVADTANNRIRRVTSTGVVSTLAGSGSAAFADGTGAGASFNAPVGVSVDSAGNVFVGDTGNHRIRKVTSAGVASTLAGSGSAAYADGTGASASFSSPAGLVAGSPGQVYVADSGNHRIRVLVVDLSIPLTTVSPTLGATAGSRVWFSAETSVAVGALDAGGIASIWYRLDGGTWTQYAGVLTPTGEGAHVLECYSVDMEGNRDATQTGYFGIDTLAPATTSSGLSAIAGTPWRTGAWSFSLVATDGVNGAGIAATTYTVDAGAAQLYAGGPVAVVGEGTHTVTYLSADVVGHVEAVHTGYVNIDSAAPALSVSAPGGWRTAVPVTVTASVTDTTSGPLGIRYSVNGSVGTTYAAGVPVSAQGTSTVAFAAVDVAGNWCATQTATVRIDTVAPTTTDDHAASYVGPATIHLSAADAASGVGSTSYVLDGTPGAGTTVSCSAIGTHTLSYRSVDVAGNAETTHTIGFTSFWPPPQTTISALPMGWVNHDVPFSLTASDVWLPVGISTYYGLNAPAITPYASTVTVTAEGTTTIAYRSVDASGDAEATQTAVVRIDKTAPAAPTISGVPGAWTSATVTFSLASTDTASGLAGMRYVAGAGALTTYTAPVAISAEGTTALAARALDVAGNVSTTSTAQVRIDRTAPVTTQTGFGGGWALGSATANLSASDAMAGVLATYYRIDSGAWTLDTGASITISSAGTHTVEYRSIDAAGNAETPKSATVRVYSGQPTASLSGIPGGWVSADHVTVSAHAIDLAGVERITIAENGGLEATYTVPVDVTAEGTTTVSARALSVAGVWSASATGTVRIDRGAPIVSAAGVPSGLATGPVEVSLAASDALSGVAGVTYRVNGGANNSYTGPIEISALGTTTVTYFATDAAGNASTPASVAFRIVVEGMPLTTISGVPSTWTSATATVSLETVGEYDGRFYALNGGEAVSYAAPFELSAEGVTSIVAWSVNGSVVETPADSAVFRRDATPPNTTSNAAATYSSAGATITLTAVDPLSGVARTRYSLDGGAPVIGAVASVSAAGPHTLEFASIDNAGNVEETRSAAFTVAAPVPVPVVRTATSLAAPSLVPSKPKRKKPVTLTTYLTPVSAAASVTVTFQVFHWEKIKVTKVVKGKKKKVKVNGWKSKGVLRGMRGAGSIRVAFTAKTKLKLKGKWRVIATTIGSAGYLGSSSAAKAFKVK